MTKPTLPDNVHVITHPLVQHKLTLMRNKEASTNSFRRLLNELSSLMAYEVCRDGLLDRHVPTIRATYHDRRDAMLAALEQQMPSGVTWTRPRGGMFLWLTLPAGVDAATLLQASLEQKVAFVPGASFHANGGGSNTMRLNFSHSAPERIAEGVSRLAQSLSALL